MSEWAAVFSALIAGIGLFFAGGQLMVMNRTAKMERRVARDGVVVSWRPTDAPRVAEADAPVLAGGATRPWRRRLVMNFAEAETALPATYAKIHFSAIEGRRYLNRWPRSGRS